MKYTSRGICLDNPLDPRRAIALIEVTYEGEAWESDLCGDDPDVAERASKLEDEATTAGKVLVQDLEGKATDLVSGWIPGRDAVLKHQSGYDANGILSLALDIQSIQDIIDLNKHFHEEGRNTEVPYVTISGLMLFPGGVNKPRFGLETSNAEYDLEEWIEVWEESASG